MIPGNSTHFGSVQDVGKCNNEELVAAQKAGAELVACGLVQKVSNLILNLNLIIENAKTGQQITGGSVDIRGNTDVSWYRDLRYLLSEHILVKQ